MDMNLFQILLGLAGGLILLLYGMQLAGEGLQKLAGNRLKHVLSRLTQNRLRAVGIGALATATVQSSTATTVMVVGFVSTALMSLPQALGLILGAHIGTTFTVQLIAFKITHYSLLLVIAGFLLKSVTLHRYYTYAGQVILGFGFIFFAMFFMGEALLPLTRDTRVTAALAALSGHPGWVIVLSAVLTGLTHSSAAVIGMAIVLASDGLIDVRTGIAVALGANVGTTLTALLASLETPAEGKRAALGHFLFNFLGVLIALPLLDPFQDLVSRFTAPFSSSVAREIANAHLLFNVANTLLWLPFVGVFSRFLEALIPGRAPVDERFKVRYLDERVLDSPELALAQATREILRMADLVQEMLHRCHELLLQDREEAAEEIQDLDNQVDFLDEAITRYLTALSGKDLSADQSRREVALLYIVNELEHVGDVCDKGLRFLGQNKIASRLRFSREGEAELRDLHERVRANLETAVAAFATDNLELARKVIREKSVLNVHERELRRRHIARLHGGLKESIETSTIHLDVIDNYKRINDHATDMAYAVMGEL